VDIGSCLFLAGLLNREPPIEPLDAVRELLRASVLEAVQDLLERPQCAPLPVVLHDRFHLLQIIPLNVNRRNGPAVLEFNLPLLGIPDLHVVPQISNRILESRHVVQASVLHELQDAEVTKCRSMIAVSFMSASPTITW